MEETTLPADTNLVCKVCGEKEFEEREGFYYCQECGTKQEQIRLVEVEQEDDFENEKLKTKKQKIQAVKTEKPQLTSWECYNYILRGYVEELLSFGAKEELKLMALQVWAAYLRRMEIAFFNRKRADLPKLGLKYLPHDAKIIYNHSWKTHKQRKRKRADDASCTSGNESTSAKTWRKNKRKLDESNYSFTSATSAGSGLSSSTSAFSNRAIKIGFNVKARKFLKRIMPKKHLEKHANDAEGQLKCHKPPKARDINQTDYMMMSINMKQIFCILGIALNLIEDEIQLSDLVRFRQEGHLNTNNVLQYFPENIASNGKELLKNINFYKCERLNDKIIREQTSTLCRNIGIYKLKNPDITKLVKRYTTELCLPLEIVVYIERLINFVPPQFSTRSPGVYAVFEARAMAYIIFTLKLLFGLDGNKEYRISEASQKLNKIINKLNDNNHEKQPHLFVWNEWVQYIEMRKIIVSSYNPSFCERFKQTQTTAQLLEQMSEESRLNEERELLFNDTSSNSKLQLKNLKHLLETFQENFKTIESKPLSLIDFKPSFTPAYSYLKNIILLHDMENNVNTNIHIPDFMHIDHSSRDVKSYLEVKPLIAYFKKHNKELKVHALSSNKNKTFLGVFLPSRSLNRSRTNEKTFFKASSDITVEEWTESIAKDVAFCTDDIEFKAELKGYKERSYYERKIKHSKHIEKLNYAMNCDLTTTVTNANNASSTQMQTNRQDLREVDLQSMHSFDLFAEDNMDPIENQEFLKQPRRNIEKYNLFEDISDEESVFDSNDEDIQTENCIHDTESIASSDEIVCLTPNSPPLSPDISQEFIKIESPQFLNNSSTVINDEEIDDSDKQNDKINAIKKDLKMYVSNMDCWMLLGHIMALNKTHKLQLQDKFPRSFNWLLETCAQTIGTDWPVVYEQLLCIETMFCLGIENLDTLKDCVYLNTKIPIKDLQSLVASYREIW